MQLYKIVCGAAFRNRPGTAHELVTHTHSRNRGARTQITLNCIWPTRFRSADLFWSFCSLPINDNERHYIIRASDFWDQTSKRHANFFLSWRLSEFEFHSYTTCIVDLSAFPVCLLSICNVLLLRRRCSRAIRCDGVTLGLCNPLYDRYTCPDERLYRS